MEVVVLGKYKGVQVPANLQGKEREDYVIRTIVEDSEFEVPEILIKDRAKKMGEEFSLNLSQQGLDIRQYYDKAGTNEKELMEGLKKVAKRQLEGRIILEAIARKENIKATNAEFNAEIEKLTLRYPIGKEEIRKIIVGPEEKRLKNDIVIQKTLEYVMAHTVEV